MSELSDTSDPQLRDLPIASAITLPYPQEVVEGRRGLCEYERGGRDYDYGPFSGPEYEDQT